MSRAQVRHGPPWRQRYGALPHGGAVLPRSLRVLKSRVLVTVHRRAKLRFLSILCPVTTASGSPVFFLVGPISLQLEQRSRRRARRPRPGRRRRRRRGSKKGRADTVWRHSHGVCRFEIVSFKLPWAEFFAWCMMGGVGGQAPKKGDS